PADLQAPIVQNVLALERIAFENGELGHTRSLCQNVGRGKPELGDFQKRSIAVMIAEADRSWTGEALSLGSGPANFNTTLVVLRLFLLRTTMGVALWRPEDSMAEDRGVDEVRCVVVV